MSSPFFTTLLPGATTPRNQGHPSPSFDNFWEPFASHSISSLSPRARPSLSESQPISFSGSADISKGRMAAFSSQDNLQLDPRDEYVRIPFESIHRDLSSETSLRALKRGIRDWLVDVVEVVASVSFNLLKGGRLGPNDAKNMAAKNMVRNVKDLFEYLEGLSLEVRFNLMEFVNGEAGLIFEHVAHRYPQSGSHGTSRRVRSHVPQIDNRESVDYDFLLAHGITIEHREDEDYSEGIMRMLNKLIGFASESFNPSTADQATNYEVFCELLEFIFEHSSHKSARATAEEAAELVRLRASTDQFLLPPEIRDTFDDLASLGAPLDDSERRERSSLGPREEEKAVEMGQKIPGSVRQFSEEEMEGGRFKAWDPSVTRLLTKWAEELRGKMANAEEVILRRLFKFKSHRGKLVILDAHLKGLLYEAVTAELPRVEEYLAGLKRENAYLQTLFAEELNRAKYSHAGTRSAIYAAKLNEIGSQYMFRYVNRLIHALLRAPRLAAQRVGSEREKHLLQSINLVTFKIGDLVRSKCHCPEQDFIRILRVLDQLHLQAPDVLRIVRVKNRLEKDNNDVLINLYFANRAECELQLAVASYERKFEKSFSVFSHFIYEVNRAELGPLSQLASIIAQLDPLAKAYSATEHYGPAMSYSMAEDGAEKTRVLPDKLREREKFQKRYKVGLDTRLPFVCRECSRLSVIHNPMFFDYDESQECSECRLVRLVERDKQKDLTQTVCESPLLRHFRNISLERFFARHLQPWDWEAFTSKIEGTEERTIKASDFPRHGFIVKTNLKALRFRLFTSFFQTATSRVAFATRDREGRVTDLASVHIHHSRQKYVREIRRKAKDMFMYEFFQAEQEVRDDRLLLTCAQEGCCGLTVEAGHLLPPAQLAIRVDNQLLQQFVDSQKSAIYANHIENSLDKLSRVLDSIGDEAKLVKSCNAVQVLEVFQCNLKSIHEVGAFKNLYDLNVSCNPLVVSLDGIQNCLKLRLLNCRECNLTGIREVEGLLKLEYLDVSYNMALNSLEGIAHHSQLIDLCMRKSSVSTLAPLTHCTRLESLDLSYCCFITSVTAIRSLNLAYLNIAGCDNIQSFSLPLPTLKSIKSIELYSEEEKQGVGYELTVRSLAKIQNDLRESSAQNEGHQYTQAVNEISTLIKRNKAKLQLKKTISLELQEPL